MDRLHLKEHLFDFECTIKTMLTMSLCRLVELKAYGGNECTPRTLNEHLGGILLITSTAYFHEEVLVGMYVDFDVNDWAHMLFEDQHFTVAKQLWLDVCIRTYKHAIGGTI